MHEVFLRLTAWLAPLTPFTMEEAWGTLNPDGGSNCARVIPETPAEWENNFEKHRWAKIEKVLLVTNGALEIERREKRIGMGLDAELVVYITDEQIAFAFDGMSDEVVADIFRVSRASITQASPPPNAQQFMEVLNVSVEVKPLLDQPKCARSWRRVADVGTDPDPSFRDLSARDADAVRWLDARKAA
jgi:isoleucyl-tRNA synthetase